jgi:hypothetical protein
MTSESREILEKGAFFASLILANGSLILSFVYQAQLLYSVTKALIIFVIMYFICRIVISAWDKVSRQSESEYEIKPTMDVLDDLDERGIKVTYNPLFDQEDSDDSDNNSEATISQQMTDDESEFDREQIPGQLNMEALSQQRE